MRRYLLPILFTCLPAFAWAKGGTSIYVCAHPDDCILFMNPNLYDDITREADKVVMIYLTSGDAGQPYDAGDSTSYPVIREQAALEATQWMADIGKNPISAVEETSKRTQHGKGIESVSYGNTVSYFLRLPDGDMYGSGFTRYGNVSLRKLQSGETASLTAIDGDHTSFAGWRDVVMTLGDIVSQETKGSTQVNIHISDPDTAQNVNDHTDHTAGGTAMLEALTTLRGDGHCYTLFKHIDYAIAERPVNLEGSAVANKAGGFAVLTATQRHFLDFHHWDEAHVSYLTRNYYARAILPQGNCSKSQ